MKTTVSNTGKNNNSFFEIFVAVDSKLMFFLVENNKGSLILMFILSLNGNWHKKRMRGQGQAIRTSDPAVRWEEDDTGLQNGW